jgi:hypothetical protein
MVMLLVAITGPAVTWRTLAAGQAQQDPPIAPEALAQIEALIREKASRTAVQQKIDSQLIYAIKMSRGEPIAPGVETLQTSVAYAPSRGVTDAPRLVVDVTAEITNTLLRQFETIGAEVLAGAAGQRGARLAVAPDRIEAIASLRDVLFIQPKQEATTHRQQAAPASSSRVDDRRPDQTAPVRRFDPNALASFVASAVEDPGHGTSFTVGQGSQASQGEYVHRAWQARGVFHTTGAGIKIGVLSDGVRNLAASQALGDLPAVSVIGNPAPCAPTDTCDEGTAMLEIVHDMAPGAQLYFASAFVSLADFAQKIRDLQAAGCTIIVDDVGYFVETPFQDGQAPGVASTTNAGIVIQAVKDVAALGVLYFSSAANSGNVNNGTSGTWEGDFLDGGVAGAPIGGTGRLHNFGTIGLPQNYNVLNAVSTTAPITLHWSDPLGGSSNDYDLFRLNGTGTTVLASSTNTQNGTQDPYEAIGATAGTPAAFGQRIVVVKAAAAAGRFLHVSTNRGLLSIATQGETHGHAATTAVGSFGVAAVYAGNTSPDPFSNTNVVESFSSDGPRRIFFNQSGAALTPGNFSSTGGSLLQKPDVAAADGVAVTGVGGFGSPFFGTSAAAPHAAAIAALLKSSNPALTAAQVRAALVASAIDIEAAGVDRDSGAGIIMAFQALQAIGATGTAFLSDSLVTATESPGNGNGAINVGEGAQLMVTLNNNGVQNAANITATLTTSTPGVTITQPATSAYPNIAVGGNAINITPFRFTLASNAACPLTVRFTLTISHTGGGPSVTTFLVDTGPATTIATTLDTTAPAALTGVTVGTSTQTGRLTRNGLVSSCAAPKAYPGLAATTGVRRLDSYAFNTCAENTGGCARVTVLAPTTGLFPVAYAPAFYSSDLSLNYAADPGASSSTAAGIPFSFQVPPGASQKSTVVVHEVDPATGIGTNYTMIVTGMCAGACATPNQVPIARARNVTVVAGAGGTAAASINDGSSDGDGDALTITQSPPGPYAVGATPVLLTVVDPKGATSQASATVTVVNLPTVTLTPSALNFGAVSNGNGTILHQTPPQQVRLTQTGTGTVSWTASSSQPWLTLNGSSTPIAGTGPATLSVAVNNAAFSLPNSGSLAATITVNTNGTAANNPSAAVTLRVVVNGSQTAPTGSFDSPTNGTTGVTGSIPVTGWAIDDIGVGAVRITRDPVAGEGANQIFIGTAVFIGGARPDVAGAFPTLPLKDQAGWGLLMLTNFLPNQGNGTFTLYAYADDVDGHSTLLGSKTITCANATATKPFGAIDTPLQGETVSGSIINFGWALTPQPKAIPTDGSTIQVIIDGAPVGTVNYNNARPDIQALFPGYANTNGAVGHRTIDTTGLANGLHTISWAVTDNAGAIDGIGSRFFTVSNSSGGSSLTAAPVSGQIAVRASAIDAADASSGVIDAKSQVVGQARSLSGFAPSSAAVATTHGLARHAAPISVLPGADGVREIRVGQLEVLRVDLAKGENRAGATYKGYERDGDTLNALPVGSTLDANTGLFSFQPGLAFGGSRDLVFTRTSNGVTETIAVRVSIDAQPASHNQRRMNIDIPRAGDVVGASFVVAGWAFDGASADGAGIDTLHIWAYPEDGGDPIWLGVAQPGGVRPDVGATFGTRFTRSGFNASVAGLPPGTYAVVVYAHSAASGTFNQAQSVRVIVK